MSTTKNFLSKKVIIVVAILAVGALSVILVVSPLTAQAAAQQQQQWQQKMMMMMTGWSDERIPQINGSVSVANETMDFINENLKVPFTAAAQTAQGQVTNGTVLGGHLGIVHGYLVYTFFVSSTGSQTGHLTIVDAGNGNVLYTSGGQPLGSFGHLSFFRNWNEHSYRGLDMPWKGNGGDNGSNTTTLR
jgi:type II secretory pathway pseudopilin PulG